MVGQARRITLAPAEEDLAQGFSVIEMENSFLVLWRARVIAEFPKPGTEHILARRIEGRMGLLSHRQTEILQRVARGDENKEIASALGIKHQTVKNHVHCATRKLGAKSCSHAVALALRSCLIR